MEVPKGQSKEMCQSWEVKAEVMLTWTGRLRVSRASAEEPGIGIESVLADLLEELVFVIHCY